MGYAEKYGIQMPHSRWKDIGGQRFGKLTAVRPLGYKKHGQQMWKCQCDCGNTKDLPIGVLHHRDGGTKSCGCARNEFNQSFKTHGKSRTKMYARWRSMKKRCTDTTTKYYKYYGGKGVKVCERWESFENFLSDMGYPPGDNYQIDRIDNDGDYSPENCQWLTASDNRKKAMLSRKRHTNHQ